MAFMVQHDDMYDMSLWCTQCRDAGLQEKADLLFNEVPNRWDTEFDLSRLNELAASHLLVAHNGDHGPPSGGWL